MTNFEAELACYTLQAIVAGECLKKPLDFSEQKSCSRSTRCGDTCISDKYPCVQRLGKQTSEALMFCVLSRPNKPEVKQPNQTVSEVTPEQFKAVQTDWANRFSVKLEALAEPDSKAEAYLSILRDMEVTGLEEPGMFRRFIATDKAKQVSALMVIRNDKFDGRLQVESLMASPSRMLGESTISPELGGATSLLASAAKLALKSKQELKLYSLKSSQSFYEKLGFKQDLSLSEDYPPMILTGKALKQLAKA